jgi:hypothetical protein
MMPSAGPSLKWRFYGPFRHFLPYISAIIGRCAKIPRAMREENPLLSSHFHVFFEIKPHLMVISRHIFSLAR